MSRTVRSGKTDHEKAGYTRWAKRQAAKKVRRLQAEELENGGYFRRVFQSWDIHDWKIRF